MNDSADTQVTNTAVAIPREPSPDSVRALEQQMEEALKRHPTPMKEAEYRKKLNELFHDAQRTSSS